MAMWSLYSSPKMSIQEVGRQRAIYIGRTRRSYPKPWRYAAKIKDCKQKSRLDFRLLPDQPSRQLRHRRVGLDRAGFPLLRKGALADMPGPFDLSAPAATGRC